MRQRETEREGKRESDRDREKETEREREREREILTAFVWLSVNQEKHTDQTEKKKRMGQN